ncbi:MAG: hypothetical protein K8R64_04995 [Methanosarcinaceae archaeon]|nr:hypothetical protein [Methanosarcinaceae archaeon]
MDIDNCHHEWNYEQDEYLPVRDSAKKHHPCKECGIINYRPQQPSMKTGKLICVIKELFEQNGISRGWIRQHTDHIKQMKRDGADDEHIIHTIMSDVRCRNYYGTQ